MLERLGLQVRMKVRRGEGWEEVEEATGFKKRVFFLGKREDGGDTANTGRPQGGPGVVRAEDGTCDFVQLYSSTAAGRTSNLTSRQTAGKTGYLSQQNRMVVLYTSCIHSRPKSMCGKKLYGMRPFVPTTKMPHKVGLTAGSAG